MNLPGETQEKSEKAGISLPTVSIVIPARNEAQFIGKCLRSVALQKYPAPLVQVLVVDNGSIDKTAPIAVALGAAVLSHPKGRVGSVRNAGASQTSGEVLAFLDADCEVGPRWLEAAIEALREEGIGMAGGGYLSPENGSWVQLAWAASKPGNRRVVDALPGGSIVVYRSLFESIGGFDEQLSAGEDDELCRKVRSRGLSVLYLADSCVIHWGYPTTLRDIAKRQVWHGGNQLDVKESWMNPQLVMTHMFAAGMLCLLLFPITQSREMTLLSAFMIALPVLILATSRARGRSRPVLVIMRMLMVGFAFYLGRSFGLINNYIRKVRRWLP